MLDMHGFVSKYAGVPAEVSSVRREVGVYLDGCSARDDVILVVSELVSNAIQHSDSKGNAFTVRIEVTYAEAGSPGHVYVEVEDHGGPWVNLIDHSRPHGLDIVAIIAPHWGIAETADLHRIVWAEVPFS